MNKAEILGRARHLEQQAEQLFEQANHQKDAYAWQLEKTAHAALQLSREYHRLAASLPE